MYVLSLIVYLFVFLIVTVWRFFFALFKKVYKLPPFSRARACVHATFSVGSCYARLMRAVLGSVHGCSLEIKAQNVQVPPDRDKWCS